MYSPKIVHSGNYSDCRTALKFLENSLTIRDLQQELEAEEDRLDRGRSTVIKMLNAAINRKKKLSFLYSMPL